MHFLGNDRLNSLTVLFWTTPGVEGGEALEATQKMLLDISTRFKEFTLRAPRYSWATHTRLDNFLERLFENPGAFSFYFRIFGSPLSRGFKF